MTGNAADSKGNMICFKADCIVYEAEKAYIPSPLRLL